MPPHEMINKEVGNYVLRSLLGEGGMGAVFLAEHRFLGTRAAIKLLHNSYARDPKVTQRFLTEARATLEIKHPGIVQILEFGQNPDGALYLVMELLEGRSLAETIAQRPFSEAATARIGAALADALAAAHGKGIIHRDLKPDNVFLVGEQVKILDFGIAKVRSSSSGTQTGSVFGTPQYMAPEQAMGSKHVSPRTDVYALGAILFEMMTGRPPFLGEEVAELITKALFEAPPRPSAFAKVSPEMEALILACLEKKPENRPSGMDELLARLLTLQPDLFGDDSTTVSPPPPRSASLDPKTDDAALAFAATGYAPLPAVSTIAHAVSETAERAPHHTVSTISHAASELSVRSTQPAVATSIEKTPRKTRILTAALAGVTALGLIAGGLFLRQSSARQSVPITAPPPTVVEKTASAPVQTLRLRLDPPDARVELDGVAVSGSTITLSPSVAGHRLVVSAPGRETKTEALPSDASGELAITLAQTTAAPTTKEHSVSHSRPHSAGDAGNATKPASHKRMGPVVEDL